MDWKVEVDIIVDGVVMGLGGIQIDGHVLYGLFLRSRGLMEALLTTEG